MKLRPKSGPSATAEASASRQTFGSSVRLMKPGPAISVLVTSGSFFSSAAIFSARSRGFMPTSLASAIAALVARSPWLASRGGSTTMRLRSGGLLKAPDLAIVSTAART
jgi:hypothetical protein